MTKTDLSRRSFLGGAASMGAGLVLGFRWGAGSAYAAEAAPFAPNAFVRIGVDDSVTVVAKHLEMGQGTYTGLATVLAEELDAAWSQVRVESAPADAKLYANLSWGGIQGTGGSSAMANSFTQLRTAGATARAMLRSAAATRWGVPEASLTVEGGAVHHAASGRVARFGDLAAAAAKLPVPEGVPLKDPADFKLVGKGGTPRVDVASKTDGTAVFSLDLRFPGMLTALVARPPRFGGKVTYFDDDAARKVRGYVQAIPIPSGVAVLATSFWAARKARAALTLQWDETAAETRSSEGMFEDYHKLAQTPGLVAHDDGDAEAALTGAAAVVEASYEFPYLAHAPMEPLDCVIQVKDGACDFWSGSQIQTLDFGVLAKTFGLPPEKVRVHTQLAGGSFGRRATPDADLATEAAAIVKATGRSEPIRLVWTREDDLAGGKYRPMAVHKVRLGIDAHGKPSGWHHRIVSQSIIAGTLFAPFMIKDGIDHTSVEGADVLPYGVAHRRVELHTPSSPVTTLWWRSVGHSTNAYLIETLIDELATAATVDPLDFRRSLLKPDARERGPLELAARKAGWGRQAPPGRAYGFAMHHSFGSYVAQIAEVSVGSDGFPKVHRVVCAVDCGRVINPSVVESQMQSGIGFGLGAALYDEVILDKGVPVHTNFDGYRPLRIHEMPTVEVHTVASEAPPTGVGEPGVPPIAAAVANAWFQLTGRRVRRLPFTRWRA